MILAPRTHSLEVLRGSMGSDAQQKRSYHRVDARGGETGRGNAKLVDMGEPKSTVRTYTRCHPSWGQWKLCSEGRSEDSELVCDRFACIY
jgi:hypothetical protein